MQDLIGLEEKLGSFDPAERRSALTALAAGGLLSGAPSQVNVNMHFHSFFSYNAEFYSPSRVAWEARKAGLYAAGLCDFDVLDGLEEFLEACLLLGLRSAVALETRVYVKDYAAVDISSPGEPGVGYMMGAGFAGVPAAGSVQAKGLAAYREGARARNVALIGRVNAKLADIAVDYEKDVMSLTPAGGATERHIISAYINKARSRFGNAAATAKFWSGVLGRSLEDTAVLLADTPALEEAVRSKLAKRGGLGYEQPSAGTFPPLEDFIAWVRSCDAIPMLAWLDGTSAGEKDARKFVEYMAGKGMVAVNIIPDRNWNIANPEAKKTKVANLGALVQEAERLGWPVNIGTEMNKLGLPFVDDLDCEALKPYKQCFLRGARIMVGHTLLQRYAGLSYSGAKSAAMFKDVVAKNKFFEAAGALKPVEAGQAAKLKAMGQEKAFEWFANEIRSQG